LYSGLETHASVSLASPRIRRLEAVRPWEKKEYYMLATCPYLSPFPHLFWPVLSACIYQLCTSRGPAPPRSIRITIRRRGMATNLFAPFPGEQGGPAEAQRDHDHTRRAQGRTTPPRHARRHSTHADAGPSPHPRASARRGRIGRGRAPRGLRGG